VAQSKNCPFGVNTKIGLNSTETSPTIKASGRVYVSTKKFAGIVIGSCYIFQLNHSINSKWKFLDYAIVALSERHFGEYLCRKSNFSVQANADLFMTKSPI
jgi:hypothetical protein